MKKYVVNPVLISLVIITIGGCGGDNDRDVNFTPSSESYSSSVPLPSDSNSSQDVIDASLLKTTVKNNPAAYIPAQCYTKTEDETGVAHNPCFACHTNTSDPNFIRDADFQLAYDFRSTTRTNRWLNLFKDRSEAVAAISDSDILDWIRKSNYFNSDGSLKLAERLQEVPDNWDFDRDGQWGGYVPDCYFNFDDEGFDRAPDGNDTGWRVFAYTPFPGTFWPTNGSTDDVLMRLPASMQQDGQGSYSRAVYKLNLAIVEAMIKRSNVAIEDTDETLYQVDLNHNGILDIANEVVFQWNPVNGIHMYYVGKAKELLERNELHIAAGLYPEGTEFLHTVRYIDIDDASNIQLSARMKELRYSYKHSWNTYSQLNNVAMTEIKESDQFPDRLRTIKGNPEYGLLNSLGWVYQGYIEDKQGELRPQSYEESLNCIGCHSGIGATKDSSFAFPRKLDRSHAQEGWYHWSQHGLAGVSEPRWPDGEWEYTEYLQKNRSGNEFRTNEEVIDKFFNENGELKPAMIEKLHSDISQLLLPSPKRALTLNKAYKVIVDEQSYIYGRDAHVKPLINIWDEIPEGQTTGVSEATIRP